ncbi:MAG: NTP transferase domain-containing protein [Bacteroidota bacterium]
MKFGVIVLCRYTSSRLPGKILKKIEGKPLLQHIVERLKLTSIKNIIVATSDEPSDQPIVEFCRNNDIEYFTGSLLNVADRFARCCKKYDLDYGIRINGDNLFVDPYTIDRMVEITGQNDYDLVTNVPGRTFPHGMSVEIINTTFYLDTLPSFNEEKYKEHVTLYFYDNPTERMFTYINEQYPIKKKINLAVDTPEDFKIVSKMMAATKSHTEALHLQDIVELYEKFKDE